MTSRQAVADNAAYGTIENREKQGSGVNAVRLTLTTGSSGFVSVWLGCVGRFDRLVIIPGSGSVQPTDQWDLTITDEDGVEIYSNTTISNTGTTVAYPSGTNVNNVYGLLTFLVENAGSEKTVRIVAYFH